MLPAAHRLSDAASFREATRRGRRASTARLVTHLLTPEGVLDVATPLGPPARIGFVVSKAVGNSVVRNRVQRRLRHAARAHLSSLPAASILVIRALPAAAGSSYGVLAADLDACLSRAGVAA